MNLGLGGIERFFTGSTSRYVVENANCNVVVVKTPCGPPEEMLRTQAIQVEEHERLKKAEEEGPAEVHDSTVEMVKKEEEIERARRMEKPETIHHYEFQDDIRKLPKGREMEKEAEERAERVRKETEKLGHKGEGRTGLDVLDLLHRSQSLDQDSGIKASAMPEPDMKGLTSSRI